MKDTRHWALAKNPGFGIFSLPSHLPFSYYTEDAVKNCLTEEKSRRHPGLDRAGDSAFRPSSGPDKAATTNPGQVPRTLSGGLAPGLTRGTGMTPIQVTRRPSISRTVI
jgi:hypothetical protein